MRFINKVIKKIVKSDINSYVDAVEIGNGSVYAKGWIFSKNHTCKDIFICFKTDKELKKLEINPCERADVYNVYANENAKKCGYEFSGYYKSDSKLNVYVEFVTEKETYIENLACVPPNFENTMLVAGKTVMGYSNFGDVKNLCGKKKFTVPQFVYEKKVDVIVPVYNGFDYLENLFKTIQKTKMDYRLIIINDCSTDERVLPFLKNFSQDKQNVILIENDENLGFVQSVNKALMLSDRDVALVNSDVILPELWLERLMLPIFKDDKIATSTPFTNSGTICSFPNFCQDNKIFMGLNVDDIDNVFRNFTTAYTSMPTGVGFCMGMSRNAINRVGILDAETFYKGYGEENDWCQRAIILGYKNVMVENLFAYHKHGASFPSEEKKRYIERNLKIINQKYPNYDKDVQVYCKADPVMAYREYAKFVLTLQKAEKTALIIDHNWGGGANSYCKIRIQNEIADGYSVLKLVKGESGMYAEFLHGEEKCGFSVADLDEFDELAKIVHNESPIEKIIINEVVSFDDTYAVLDYIKNLKTELSAKLIMLGHDFYSICPSIYLIDNEGKHCFKPDKQRCEECIKDNADKFSLSYGTIEKWRKEWGDFLSVCDELTVFSQNSRDYFMYHYPMLENIKVVPHKVDYVPAIDKYETNKDRLVIGILGNFMRTKGSDVVFEMLDIIQNEKLPVDIVVIGENLEKKTHSLLKTTGRYKVENLPNIMSENKVDIIFIASIWPETFSYTTQEVINMALPVASFDIGAPAERIKQYDKGLVISEMNAKTALEEISRFMKKGLK